MAHPKEFAEGLSIGIIMDGNGRWAKSRGLPRTAGHKKGAQVFQDIADYCDELGVESVYFYAFSTENWKRPAEEVGAIMRLFGEYLIKGFDYKNRNIRICFMGDRTALDPKLQKLMNELEEDSAAKTGMTLNIAVNYGGRPEIVRAAQQGREEGVEVGVVHAEHGIAEHRTAARGHGTGSGKPAVSGAQHNAVRRAGRAEYAPAGALRGGPYVRRGVEAVAVLAVDLKVGVFAQRDRAAVQKLIERARVAAAAAQGAARHGAAGQGARDVAAVGKQRVELRGEQRHLLLRVGTQGCLLYTSPSPRDS